MWHYMAENGASLMEVCRKYTIPKSTLQEKDGNRTCWMDNEFNQIVKVNKVSYRFEILNTVLR